MRFSKLDWHSDYDTQLCSFLYFFTLFSFSRFTHRLECQIKIPFYHSLIGCTRRCNSVRFFKKTKRHNIALPPIATIPSVGCRSSSVQHEVNGSYNSRTVWPRITRFYTDIQSDLLSSPTGYDVTGSLRSAAIYIWILHKSAWYLSSQQGVE